MAVQCPCCSQPIDVEPHEPGESWTPGQLALMRKLNGKVNRQVIASIWGVSGDAITSALLADRKGTRAPMRSRKRVNPRTLLHRQRQEKEAALPEAKKQAKRKCLGCGKQFTSLWIGNRMCSHCGGTGAKSAKEMENVEP